VNAERQAHNRQSFYRALKALLLAIRVSRARPREIRPVVLYFGLFGLFLAGCATHSEDEWKKTVYTALYNKPLLSPGAQFSATPPAVQNTIRAEAGATGISSITKEFNGDHPYYRVDFISWGFPPLYVAPDGSVLDPDLNVLIPAPIEKVSSATGSPLNTLMLGQLPPAVVRAIQLRAPDAEVANIEKDTHGDHTAYFITFKDNRRAPLHLASDGTLLMDYSK
jgi:hypothetical protein